jgi:hypothetical protein
MSDITVTKEWRLHKHMHKAELLKHYAQKNTHHYLQLDAFVGVAPGDPFMWTDQDGDCVMCGVTPELRSGTVGVRVQILEGTSREDASRTLSKLLDGLDDAYDFAEEG